jgi:hypothetical protein
VEWLKTFRDSWIEFRKLVKPMLSEHSRITRDNWSMCRRTPKQALTEHESGWMPKYQISRVRSQNWNLILRRWQEIFLLMFSDANVSY